jgi:hypothetical protein
MVSFLLSARAQGIFSNAEEGGHQARFIRMSVWVSVSHRVFIIIEQTCRQNLGEDSRWMREGERLQAGAHRVWRSWRR